jgi:hypothetical protein
MALGSAVMPADFDFNTYQSVSLDFTSSSNTTYKVYGRYNNEQEYIGKFGTTTTSAIKEFTIPSYFDELYVQAYTFSGLKDYVFDLNNLDTYLSFDFSKNGKWAGKAQVSSGAPTNVLYAANSNTDFLVVSTIDYTYETLPDLLAGTIA